MCSKLYYTVCLLWSIWIIILKCIKLSWDPQNNIIPGLQKLFTVSHNFNSLLLIHSPKLFYVNSFTCISISPTLSLFSHYFHLVSLLFCVSRLLFNYFLCYFLGLFVFFLIWFYCIFFHEEDAVLTKEEHEYFVNLIKRKINSICFFSYFFWIYKIDRKNKFIFIINL
jgi:hypothetical protein